MALIMTYCENPTEADREAVLAPLRAYNIAQAGDPRIRPLVLTLSDASGATMGGLWGRISYDWLFVELLSVDPAHRGGGHGVKLMREAEARARAEGCVGIWLDTYDFQARGFYEKLGFEVFGSLDGDQETPARFFLKKRLAAT